jgi:N-acetylneuraminic acid mutarotase
LFGGVGFDITDRTQYLNDLWKFSNGQWTWISGSQAGAASGVYGMEGTPASSNTPGAREYAVTWADAAGDFWLFGGYGYDSTGALGDLNDLWKYSGGQWTWVAGSDVVNQPGVYGTLGSPAAANVPSARREAVGWTDSSGSLWLFGGGYGQSLSMLNDLWHYSAGQWTWMGGSSTPGQAGVYGTQGAASSTNIPGSRVLAFSWTDPSGKFWLFGGNGDDSTGMVDYLNDLWKYSGGQWTWVSGSNLGRQSGKYGTQGVGANSNSPGGRFAPAGWVDGAGRLYLFGGDGYDSSGTLGFLNDLWKYQP